MTSRLLEILTTGPHTRQKIEQLLGMPATKDQRAIRLEIRRLRRQGWPIYSGDDGYKLDATKIQETIAAMRSRAKDMERTANLLETLTARHQIGLLL